MDWATIQSNSWILSGLVSLFLIILGIALGKSISYLLTKLGNGLDMGKKIRPSFLGLIITLIRWSIYLVFLNLALLQLPIQNISSFTTNILLVIPIFIGAIILIVLGFAIGNYLKEVVEESQIHGSKFLSHYLFYFVIFVTGIYALKIILFSFKDSILDYVILVPVVAFVFGVTYHLLRKN